MGVGVTMRGGRRTVEVFEERVVGFADPLELSSCVRVAGILVRVGLERELVA